MTKEFIKGGYSNTGSGGGGGGGGGGSGTVTSVTSPNNTINVTNPTTTPQLDVNTGNTVGKIVQVQASPNGAALPVVYSGNTTVTNTFQHNPSVISSLDTALSEMSVKIPASYVQTLNTLNGDVILSAGSNVTLNQTGNTIQISAAGSGASGVSSLNSLTGGVTLVAGNNITVSQAGQNITINAQVYTQGVLPIVAVWDYNKYNPAMTYNNGVFTANNNGILGSIDQVTVATGARVAIINYTTQAYNGIYNVTSLGSASTKFSLTRATDFNSPDNMKTGILFPVNNSLTKSGAGLYAGSILTLAFPVTTVGTTSVYFTVLTPYSINPTGWVVTPALDNKYLSANQDVTNLANGSVNNTKFQYLSNVTSDIQSQLNNKISPTSSTIPVGSLLAKTSAGWDILPQGASGQFLTSSGTGTNPIWVTGQQNSIMFTWTPVDANQSVGYASASGDGCVVGNMVFLRFAITYTGNTPNPDYNAQFNGWDTSLDLGTGFDTGIARSTVTSSSSTVVNQVIGGNNRLNFSYNGKITLISQLINTQVVGQIQYRISNAARNDFLAKVANGTIPVITG